jgi:hypothetical protein
MMRNLLVALLANGAALAANPVKDAVPLFFIANHGQAPSAVRFMAKGSGLTAYFSPGGALFRVAGRSVHMQFEKANPSPLIEGIERLPGHANFLIGAPRDWRPDVPLYGAVAYRALYPGIDVVYGGEGRDLKSEFVVAPGADPSRIRIRYAGAGGVRIEEGANPKLTVNDISSLEDAKVPLPRSLRIRIPLETSNEATVDALHTLCTQRKGEAKVLFDVERQGDFMVVMEAEGYNVQPDRIFIARVEELCGRGAVRVID